MMGVRLHTVIYLVIRQRNLLWGESVHDGHLL